MFCEKLEFYIVIEPGNDSIFRIDPLFVKTGNERTPVESI